MEEIWPEFSGAQITSETSKYIVRFVNEVNTHQDKDAPYLLFGGDFGGATWPNDGPRKISKFAGAVVVADAVRAADAAHKLAFTITATVAQRRELASLNAQAGRSSSWRRLTEENFPALSTAVAQARTAVTRIKSLQKTLEGSRRRRALIKRPIDEGLLGSCLFERGVARLEAEVAAGSALLDAAYEHLAAIETVGARRYALRPRREAQCFWWSGLLVPERVRGLDRRSHEPDAPVQGLRDGRLQVVSTGRTRRALRRRRERARRNVMAR